MKGFGVALLTVLLLGVGSLDAVSQAAPQADVAKQFVGMWRLVSWSQRLADGSTRHEPRSVSYIIYTDTGHMCWVAMDPNRPLWKSARAPTESEAVVGLRGLGAYCASVEVHASEGFVLHRVEIEKSPNLVGITRKRWFAFQGPNQLTLRVDAAELTPPVVENTLIWERVEK